MREQRRNCQWRNWSPKSPSSGRSSPVRAAAAARAPSQAGRPARDRTALRAARAHPTAAPRALTPAAPVRRLLGGWRAAEIQRVSNQREQALTQVGENKMVIAELEFLEDDAKIFKLIGPVLVPQDLIEVRALARARRPRARACLGAALDQARARAWAG
jgi:hypothetical protein